MSDSAISQHLRKLKDKVVVKNRKDSQTVYYSLESKLFLDILSQYFVIPDSYEDTTLKTPS